LSVDGQKVYQTLSAATQFTIGPAGFAGFSNEENALRTLLNEHDAERACINLVSSANHEGGLYGLLGLRILNSDAFPLQLRKYRLRQPPAARVLSGMTVAERKIISIRGCFILRVDWLETLSQLESGAFDKPFQLDGKPSPLSTIPNKSLDANPDEFGMFRIITGPSRQVGIEQIRDAASTQTLGRIPELRG
jgi:hypothetical protein